MCQTEYVNENEYAFDWNPALIGSLCSTAFVVEEGAWDTQQEKIFIASLEERLTI